MPAQALTTEFLATLPGREPASGAVSYFDTEIKGFLLEHRASGGATCNRMIVLMKFIYNCAIR